MWRGVLMKKEVRYFWATKAGAEEAHDANAAALILFAMTSSPFLGLWSMGDDIPPTGQHVGMQRRDGV